ncbi:MAG TPA: imidazole glycerol phosphate synthase cyclase subunit [Chitinophagaceae bacterium]|jgi:cyclase|nr:imidazole glycerol phosphate synthase cyclase subunit [Chitinophagaceae bacterium]
MLKIRVIPTLLWKNFGLVKGVGFNSWRRVGSILPAVKVYNTRQVDEMIIVDISASTEQADPDFEMLSEIAHECFVPLTFGGGIRTLEHITKALRLGADKIALNTAALEDPQLIRRAADRFGSQCVVVSIDAAKGADGVYYCFSHSGSRMTEHKVVEWAKEAEELGAGEILLTDVQLDGSMEGYNLQLIRDVSNAVNIPVIASGGAGKLEDFSEAILSSGASAVAAASLFHFTQTTPLEIKRFLGSKNVMVRNVHA